MQGADAAEGDSVPLAARLANQLSWLKLARVTRLAGVVQSPPKAVNNPLTLTRCCWGLRAGSTSGSRLFAGHPVYSVSSGR